MRTTNPAGVLATFASAVLSLMLPASAMSAPETIAPRPDPAAAERRTRERTPEEVLRNDPILKSTWGPGDPGLVVSQFQIRFGSRRPETTPPPIAVSDDSRGHDGRAGSE
jgi:hypothetical protein